MLNRLSLRAMAEGVRRGEFSPRELRDAHLMAIEAANPVLNAFVQVFEDAGTESHPDGPLRGVPVSVKDSFDVAGSAARCGSLLRPDVPAGRDSAAVERVRAAGAVLIGRTSTPEFLMNYETDNRLIGRTSNPWDLSRTPGGSSGGESAAIAAFLSAGGVGSDGGGSIRVPAHFCGICGLKPTPGRVPARGHWPEITHPTGFMGVAGPMARTAADLRLLFEVLSGYDPGDPFSEPASPAARRGWPLRVAVMEQYGSTPVEPEVLEAVRAAAKLCEETGCEVIPFDGSLLEGAFEMWRFLFIEYAAPFLRALIGKRREECSWTGVELIDTVAGRPEPTIFELSDVLARRDGMRARLLEWMKTVPVILAPPFGVRAFPHRARRFRAAGRELEYMEVIQPAVAANLLGLPSLAIPVLVGTDGLPAGVQLMGAPWSEELLLSLAEKLEEARGPFPSPPGLES
jgi:Asp-tRNA(Asn)/Glu-tRNA(Gln) amidotransferase A subunit family amidase